MNCREASKFLYAFADGELETRDNLTVLEHVNMCPECCKKVTAQQELRTNVGRVLQAEAAPESLRTGILSAIGGVDGGSSSGSTSSEGEPFQEVPSAGGQGSSRIIPFTRYLMPAVVAAAAVFALLMFTPVGLTPVNSGKDSYATISDNSPHAVEVANAIYASHVNALAHVEELRDPSLPKDPMEAARALSAKLGQPMLICQKLAEPTATLECGSICQLDLPDGCKVEGGRLVFRLSDNQYLSLLSAKKHVGELASLKRMELGDRRYAVLRPSQSEDSQPATVIIFDCPATTHFVCAPMDADKAVQMAADMNPTIATASNDPPLEAMMVSINAFEY
jgi:anti-sigma factor (TIGR02949 family)